MFPFCAKIFNCSQIVLEFENFLFSFCIFRTCLNIVCKKKCKIDNFLLCVLPDKEQECITLWGKLKIVKKMKNLFRGIGCFWHLVNIFCKFWLDFQHYWIQAGAELHTWKKFLALLAAHGEYSFSSDTFGILFSQSESKMWQNW